MLPRFSVVIRLLISSLLHGEYVRTFFLLLKFYYLFFINSYFNQLVAFGFRVVIDSSENAIPVFETTREQMLHIEPMTIETLSNIPKYSTLLNRLEKAGLKDVVWAVIGGVPSRLNKV